MVIASFHWGLEFHPQPSDRQRELAHDAVGAGADPVIGHHPHVLQPLEEVPPSATGGRRALIAYSLGNFVFDQRGGGRDESLILSCTLGRNGLETFRSTPVRIVDAQVRKK